MFQCGLFRPESDRRLDRRRATSWNHRRSQRCRHQHTARGCQNGRIVDVVDRPARKNGIERDAQRQAETEADAHGNGGRLQRRTQYRTPGRAKGEANRELTGAMDDRIGHHAEEPERGEQ